MPSIRKRIQKHASDLGFTKFGVTKVQPSPGFERLKEWLERGYAGTMEYIPKRLEAYRHPESVLEGCKSVIMLALPYVPSPSTTASKVAQVGGRVAPSAATGTAKIASYASGDADYHDVIRESLNQICEVMETLEPGSRNRGTVDTAPLMERDFAQLAGLGWIGKNTLLLNRDIGSYFFLAAILTDIELEADDPFLSDHCGSCTACLDACPTSAFVGPRVLNASRCISYLTIENRADVEPELAVAMGDWLFGCDVCQMVCPWNRKLTGTDVSSDFQHTDSNLKSSLEHWLTLDQDRFRALYRKTPFWRTKLTGMQRNAMIVAANQGRKDLRSFIEPFQKCSDPVLAKTAIDSLQRLDQ